MQMALLSVPAVRLARSNRFCVDNRTIVPAGEVLSVRSGSRP